MSGPRRIEGRREEGNVEMAELRSVNIYCKYLNREVTIDITDIKFDSWQNCGTCHGDNHGSSYMWFGCICGHCHSINLIEI